MKRIILVTVFVLVAQVSLMAQGASAFNVFPQIADGDVGNGSYYQTFVFATNVNAEPANCGVRLYGVPANRLNASSPTGILPALGSVGVWTTSGSLSPLATGYATLACDRPVAAFAAYLFSSADGVPISGTSVFSSPATMRAQFVVIQQPGTRLGLAVANDTDTAGQYRVAVSDLLGQPVVATTISVPARSNSPKYLDEIVALPQSFLGTVVITSLSGPFSVVGLSTVGSVLIGQPAAIY